MLNGQSFELQVSSDSVLVGNYIEVRFTIDNVDGEFEAPNLSDFIILSGPNISSAMQIINGKMSSQKSYSFYIQPKEIGNYYIKPAYLITHEKTYETTPLEINVFPNPAGIKVIPEQPNNSFHFDFPNIPNQNKKEEKLNKKPNKPLKRI